MNGRESSSAFNESRSPAAGLIEHETHVEENMLEGLLGLLGGKEADRKNFRASRNLYWRSLGFTGVPALPTERNLLEKNRELVRYIRNHSFTFYLRGGG